MLSALFVPLVCMAVASEPAWADAARHADSVVGAKRPEPLSFAPANIIIITRATIDIRGYRSLRDVLEDIPGVEVQRNSSPTYRDYYTLRGLSGNQKFMVMHDGFRMDAPTATPHAISENYALTNVQRVEILFGPASAIYGTDAYSGVINIVSVPGSTVGGLFADASYGRLGTAEGHFVYGADYEGFSWAATGAWSQSQNFAFMNDPVYSADFSVGNESVAFDSRTRSYLMSYRVNAGHYELGWFRNSERHSSSLGLDPSLSRYSADATRAMMIDSLYLSYFYDSGEEGWTLRWTLGYGTYELSPISMREDQGTGFTPAHIYAWGTRTHLEEQIDWVLTDWLMWSVGGATDLVDAVPETAPLPSEYDTSLPTGFQFADAPDATDLTADIHNVRDQIFGLYSQFHIDLFEGSQLTVGARYDASRRYGGMLSPRLALVMSRLGNWDLKLLYGEGFHGPSPYEGFGQDGVDGWQASGRGSLWSRVPSPELKPERVRTAEMALIWTAPRGVQMRLNGFGSEISELMTIVEAGPGFSDGAQKRVNAGEGAVYGATLSAAGQFRLGAWLLEPHGSYAWIDGDLDGEALPYTSTHSVKLGLDMRWKQTSLSFMARYGTEQRHPSSLDADGSPVTVKGSMDTRLFLEHTVFTGAVDADGRAPSVSVWFRGDNLLDQRAWDLPTASRYAMKRIPRDPLRVQVGMSFGIPGV